MLPPAHVVIGSLPTLGFNCAALCEGQISAKISTLHRLPEAKRMQLRQYLSDLIVRALLSLGTCSSASAAARSPATGYGTST